MTDLANHRLEAIARLRSRYVVDSVTGCWVWTNGLKKAGYAGLLFRGAFYYGHRFSYLIHVGPIPEGLHIDHLCRNRACVRPDHLEAVTCRENILRGEGLAAANAGKTHCKRGHAFTEDNTKLTARGRTCRTCHRNWRLYTPGPGKAAAQPSEPVRRISPDHCANGHEYTEENTRISRGKRVCRECQRRYRRESYTRRKPVKNAQKVAPGGAVTPTGGADAEGACSQ